MDRAGDTIPFYDQRTGGVTPASLFVAFHTQLETTEAGQLSFEERFALLMDQQWLWKENRALARRLRYAHLKERGVIEDIDYQRPRGLDRKLVRTLASSEWVRQHQNLLLLGPTGIGKSWLGSGFPKPMFCCWTTSPWRH